MSQRPRVLLHAFSTFQLGGPQARFVQLANALGPAYEHHIVAMDNRFDAGERLSANVRWQPVQMTVKKGGLLANRSVCRQQLQRLKPDLLLSYNWGAIEWAAANLPRVVPQVHVEDGFGPEEATTQLPRRVWTRRVLLGLGRVPVVVASRRLEAIAKDIWKLPHARVRFLANGVALSGSTQKARGQRLAVHRYRGRSEAREEHRPSDPGFRSASRTARRRVWSSWATARCAASLRPWRSRSASSAM